MARIGQKCSINCIELANNSGDCHKMLKTVVKKG